MVGVMFGSTIKFVVNEVAEPLLSVTVTVKGYVRFVRVVTIDGAAMALTETLVPTIAAVIVVSAGVLETATVSGVFVSATVATLAFTGVGVPRRTVMLVIAVTTGAVCVEVIVKLTSEMSKKMLPTASTLIRPRRPAWPGSRPPWSSWLPGRYASTAIRWYCRPASASPRF